MTITQAPATSISSGAPGVSELLAEAFDKFELALQQPSQLPDGHLSTGFAGLDAMTQGLYRSSLVVLAGSTGMGKTALALNLAQSAQRGAGHAGVWV